MMAKPKSRAVLAERRSLDTVEVFRRWRYERPQFYWHRKSRNGNIVTDSAEGYTSRSRCVDMALGCNGDLPLDRFVGIEGYEVVD